MEFDQEANVTLNCCRNSVGTDAKDAPEELPAIAREIFNGSSIIQTCVGVKIMRFSKVLACSATVVMSLFAVSASKAQMVVDKNRSYFSPDQQFGFGVNNGGMTIQYALGPAFHLGLNLNLDFQSKQSTSETTYDFGPYAKFLFNGEVIKPYIMAALGVIQRNSGSFNVNKSTDTSGFSITSDLPDPEIKIYLALGAEHFFNQNVGIYGHVNLVEAQLAPNTDAQPATTQFGLQGGIVGVEFFF